MKNILSYYKNFWAMCLIISLMARVITLFPLYPDLNRIEFFVPAIVFGIFAYKAFSQKWSIAIFSLLLTTIISIAICIIFKQLEIDLNQIIFAIISWTIITYIIYGFIALFNLD